MNDTVKNLGVVLSVIASFAVVVLLISADSQRKVVCFGDSITNGARADGDSWVHYLKQEHPGINWVNAGRNGRKTADRGQLLPVIENNPDADYFLIFLGVNDLKDGTKAIVASCVENVRWMIEIIRERNAEAEIVLLAPTDINLDTMDSVNVRKMYNENTKQSLQILESEYRTLAKRRSVEFISLLNAVSPPNYVDGLHPNRAGQKEIARAVWEGFEKILK
ncbi:MAG: SGNH/GDSL hydrolase family protein [Candidatus Marinimicrobia bacterium]|nr:SGNH/GDSL hydrolase family protein [Candidatus Neomarinimicrobiota bacterium]MCF7828343.1 SGNH/GDSL hydrolase family protein [Candidatus Neomarinimicrobiota bacterium]MCF7879482.1 SGNH/GDSL hydrolase family protein [Candidatus Neomarinimicrobiota bacterium]